MGLAGYAEKGGGKILRSVDALIPGRMAASMIYEYEERQHLKAVELTYVAQ